MIIEEKDFTLEFEDDHNRFTLSLLYVKNAKKENRSEEFKIYGYGMSLEKCMSVIINYRISKKFETLSLKQYLEEFKKETQVLKDLTKTI